MSNNQLRCHLLKELTDMVMKKLNRKESPPSPESTFYGMTSCWDITPLLKLLMSGRGPAQAVQMSLPSGITVIEIAQNRFDVQMKISNRNYIIEPVYFKKLVLRWTRALNLCYRDVYPVIPEYITMLQNHNSIESLRFRVAHRIETAVAIINACPDLSVLNGNQEFFSLLFEHADVNLTTIRSLEIVGLKLYDEDSFDCKQVFECFANYPERLPLLETLVISATDEFDMAKCLSRNVINSVKSLEIEVINRNSRPVDFSYVSSIPKFFQNIENVCLTYDTKHYATDSMKPVQMLKDFQSSFNFTFNYNLKASERFQIGR